MLVRWLPISGYVHPGLAERVRNVNHGRSGLRGLGGFERHRGSDVQVKGVDQSTDGNLGQHVARSLHIRKRVSYRDQALYFQVAVCVICFSRAESRLATERLLNFLPAFKARRAIEGFQQLRK